MPFVAPESDKKKPPAKAGEGGGAVTAPAQGVTAPAQGFTAPAQGFTAPPTDRPKGSMPAPPRQRATAVRAEKLEAEREAARQAAAVPRSGPDEYVNAFSRATAPAATFAGTGAAIGGAMGGPVGALFGAGAGLTTLAAGDTLAWIGGETGKLFDPNFNLTGPSDAIRAGLDATTLTHVPSKDPNVQIFNSGMETAAQSFGAAGAVNYVARKAAPLLPSFLKPVANFLATPTPAAVNVSSGFGAGAADEIAAQRTDNPWVRLAAGVGGGIVGGSLGDVVESVVKAPFKSPAPTAASLSADMTARYKAAHDAGIQWAPAKVDGAVARAVDDAGFDLAESAATHPIITAALDDLRARSRNAKTGTLTSRELELWRKDFRKVTAPLSDDNRIAATRVLESIDAFGTNPQVTLNALRGNVFSSGQQAYDITGRLRAAQDAVRTHGLDATRAEATFNAVPPTDVAAKKAAADALASVRTAQAAAQKAADDLVAPAKEVADRFKTNLDDMVKNDPAMRGVAKAHETAVSKAASADRAATAADDAYTALANETMTAEAAEAAADAAYEAAKVRFAGNTKTFAMNTGKTKNAAAAAKARATELRAKTAEMLKKRDDLDTTRGAADANRTSALTDMQQKQVALARAESDAAAKSGRRTSEMAAARGTYPDTLNAQQFEGMPAAARAARGNTREALQDQVRAFTTQSGGYEFRRLPTATQRELVRFMNGGGASERTLSFIGTLLTPGAGRRHLLGNALSMLGVGGAATGAGFVPLAAQLGLGFGAQGAANVMASQGFNRVRDMVAHGVNLPTQTPSNVVSSAVRNAMIAQPTNNRGHK